MSGCAHPNSTSLGGQTVVKRGQTVGDSPELDVPEDVADAVLDLRLRRERGRGGEERERAAVRYTPPCECIVTQSRSCYHPEGPSKRRVVPEVVGVTY